MAAKPRQQPEFSRLVALGAIGEEELAKHIEATAAERSALAARFGLLALDRLAADLRLARTKDGTLVRVTGRFQADVTQSCVVSLAPVSSRLEESFTLLYTTRSEADRFGGEIFVDPDEDDPPEPLPPGGMDLGEAVAEQVALALDPYPRAEGVVLERDRWGGGPGERQDRPNPFAVLASLKKP